MSPNFWEQGFSAKLFSLGVLVVFEREGMKNRISKSEMRILTKELTSLAEKYGCKVKIRRRPIVWNRYGEGKPNFGEVRGLYAGNLKEISVVIYGRPARRKILACLAHEVRHAEHDVLGLFNDYYRKGFYEAVQFVNGNAKKLSKGFKKQCTKTAFLAENDCNKWADKFLVRNNIKPINEVYPFRSTVVWYLNERLKHKGF